MASIIFDMDGTIADSFDYVSDFIAHEADKKTPLSLTEKQALRGKSMAAMAKQLGYHWWSMPRLFFKGRRQMHRSINHVKIFSGIKELIRKLHAEGHELFVLSSNSSRNVRHFLSDQQISEHFVQIYGGAGIFGKAPALKRLLREQSLDVKNCVYIGDELRDVDAAKSIDMRVVAVSWGFANRDDLSRSEPTALVDSAEDLMKFLEEI